MDHMLKIIEHPLNLTNPCLEERNMASPEMTFQGNCANRSICKKGCLLPENKHAHLVQHDAVEQ